MPSLSTRLRRAVGDVGGRLELFEGMLAIKLPPERFGDQIEKLL